MVASEKTLPINVAAAADLPPGAQQQQYSPLPSVFRAIEVARSVAHGNVPE